MNGQTGIIILYILVGFFGFLILVVGTTIWILWRRRKLCFCNFLNDSGQWERQSYLAKDMKDTFQYDNATYRYTIKKCNRDKINRPVAHYYKGNPEQINFNASQYCNKKIKINASSDEITQNDFFTLAKTKVLKDLFSDDEVLMLLWIILGAIILMAIVVIIFVKTHNPPCVLDIESNETISGLTDICRNAILKKV